MPMSPPRFNHMVNEGASMVAEILLLTYAARFVYRSSQKVNGFDRK